jgi:cytochrome P450
MEKLQDNPTLIESAIEELLRYESQVQWVPRCALEDIEVHGQLIHQNQVVMFGLGAANRDPLRFSEPDQVDITRTDNRHVAFGFTPHSCFGVPLARPFLRIAIKAVLQRMKGLRLATDQLEWIEAPVFRALKSLPITFA